MKLDNNSKKPFRNAIIIITILMFSCVIALSLAGCTGEFDSETYDATSTEVTLTCSKDERTHFTYNPALKMPTSHTDTYIILYDKDNNVKCETDNDTIVKKVGNKKKIDASRWVVTEKVSGKIVSTYYKIQNTHKKLYFK